MKRQTKEERIEEIVAKTKETLVNTPSGKVPLFYLLEKVGVEKSVLYFNFIEVPLPKRDKTAEVQTVVRKVIHNRGFIFRNKLEIKNVDKKVFNIYKLKSDIVERRERI